MLCFPSGVMGVCGGPDAIENIVAAWLGYAPMNTDE